MTDDHQRPGPARRVTGRISPSREALAACAFVFLAVSAPPRAPASETAFDSLAFRPDRAPGPEVRLPDHPAGNWTRVLFAPQATNDFPEQLQPAALLALPAEQVSGLAVHGPEFWVGSTGTRRIYHRDTRAGASWDSFAAPGESPAGLCWDQVPYRYGWHCWLPEAARGVRTEGWWTVTTPETKQTRRL